MTMKFTVWPGEWCTIVEAESPIDALHQAKEEAHLIGLEPYQIRAKHVTPSTDEDLAWFDEQWKEREQE